MPLTKQVQLSPRQRVTLTFIPAPQDVARVFEPALYSRTGGRFDPATHATGLQTSPVPEQTPWSVLTDQEHQRMSAATVDLLVEAGVISEGQAAAVLYETRRPQPVAA